MFSAIHRSVMIDHGAALAALRVGRLHLNLDQDFLGVVPGELFGLAGGVGGDFERHIDVFAVLLLLAFSDMCSSACFISSKVMTEYCFFWKSIEVMVRLSMSMMLAWVALWCTILLPLNATVPRSARAPFSRIPRLPSSRRPARRR